MRNCYPKDTAESASTPNYHRDPLEKDVPPSLMAYQSLETVQQRLDVFEDRFADQTQQDDGSLLPRIARVAPMSATAGSTRDHQLPARINPGSYGFSGASATARVTATATTATVSAPASVAAAAATGTGAVAVTGRAAAGAARTMGVRSTVWNAPHSAANASATSNPAAYASPRGRVVPNYTRPIEPTEYQPYLVCVATSHHNYCKVDYNSPAMSAYVGGPYSNTGSYSANNFAKTLANSNLNPEAPVFRPRMYREPEMTDVSARTPCSKVAKRSEQHTSVRRNDNMVAGPSRKDDDEDMDVDV